MVGLLKKLVISLLFISCNPFAINPITIYEIDRGDHFINKGKNKISPIYSERIEFLFSFNHTHLYSKDIPNDENKYDINKLYGITSFHIHSNSARFGWRCLNDSIEIFAYWYVNNQRGFKKIGTTTINKQNFFSIDVTGHYYVWRFNNKKFSISNTKNMGAFRSFPFFGGQNTAPHKMIFKIKEL